MSLGPNSRDGSRSRMTDTCSAESEDGEDEFEDDEDDDDDNGDDDRDEEADYQEIVEDPLS